MGKRKIALVLPDSNNDFLKNVLECLKKRSKALKNKTSKISFERFFVEHEGKRLEKLEIKSHPSHSSSKSCPLVVDVWEDRWIYITFSEWKNDTWDWEWSSEGILLPIYDGVTLVSAMEATLATAFGMDGQSTGKFDEIWVSLLARGPELVG